MIRFEQVYGVANYISRYKISRSANLFRQLLFSSTAYFRMWKRHLFIDCHWKYIHLREIYENNGGNDMVNVSNND